MPLPTNWNTVTLTATFLRSDGEPATGAVQFVPQRAIGMGEDIVLPNPITAGLDGSGDMVALLPCPDDAGAGFTTLVYKVTERVPFGREYYVQLDSGMTTEQLADLPQVSAPVALDAAYGRIAVLTAAEYAALSPPDPNTIYAVTA